MSKDKLIAVRVDSKLLDSLKKTLGVDESKTIRACMNCTDFVIQRLFGGEVTYIFKRDKKDEKEDLYSKL